MESAFGVDHGVEISKKKKAPTAGRLATGALFPGVHGAVAGKKGHKLKAAGGELAGFLIGSAVPGPGSVIGGGVATNMLHNGGNYKKQRAGAI